MKLITVVGARPNFMKVAAIVGAIRRFNASRETTGTEDRIEHLLVHTGQHYDSMMSDPFFSDLGLPAPDFFLGVGGGSHACQTADVLKKFETVLVQERPKAVIVVGDVNSTMAAALATVKMSFDERGTRPLLAHVEAGLRSYDRVMPEEMNRIITDHVSDLLFVTEPSGCENLRKEGIHDDAVYFVGNTMIDTLLALRERASGSDILHRLGLPMDANSGTLRPLPYAVLTLHRPANVDSGEALLNLLEALADLAQRHPIIFPVHPRTRNRVKEFKLEKRFGISNHSSGIIMTGPLGYLDFVCLMSNSELVITDSGGIQEETTALGIPCVTVRNNTERPVTIHAGTNVLAGTDKNSVAAAVGLRWGTKAPCPLPEKWDGKAAERIVEILYQSLRGDAALLRNSRSQGPRPDTAAAALPRSFQSIA